MVPLPISSSAQRRIDAESVYSLLVTLVVRLAH